MDIKEISLTERQRHWLEHLRACDASGKGIAGYAASHGLDAKAMYAGKKVLVKKGVLPRTRPSRFQRAAVKVLYMAAPGASSCLMACRWHFPAPWMLGH